MIELRTPGEIDAMRAAGAVVADMHAAVHALAAPGVRLTELDAVARQVLADAGATSPFLGYAPLRSTPPFPGVLCLSVNDVALHGIPTAQELEDGDLLSVDAGATLDGWVGDAARTYPIGTPRPEDLQLVETTERALAAGIAAAVVGNRIGDISAAIAEVGRAGGCGINTDQGGHGVGRSMHEAPSVPNEGRAGRGLKLRAGLVIAIEPWFLAGGSDDYRVDADGWTLRSADGSRAAHVEHTVAVTDDGPRILTAPR
ncbi:type I methionyl aminopeptidase [Modestobacter roseus]|uniref:Methionine aminopeptidase n=1 Tax=Modestobacter roseus TaxID=1181884 RepID=A0A562IT71_9ACTN|nr:type I methionyl aminopeptidase [Modestobacter roseus]MQA35041.1 type I methionyl aminopeptidase [Modestobacter roseus]TWH74092.1 methionine aminopeptidase type I [Modestobacter roseus]